MANILPPNRTKSPTPIRFHFTPLELGEAALKDFFGYQLEGFTTPDMIEPGDVQLLCFKRGSMVARRTAKAASWSARLLSSLFGQKPKA